MKVFINIKLPLFIQGEVWSSQNGSTRRTLVVINKTNDQPSSNVVKTSLGTLDKGNHSFILLNEEKEEDKGILGLFLNSAYGYQLLEGKELYSNYSSGGYGNSCSKFGIYEVGALLEVNAYKNRKTPSYFKLTEQGWVEVPVYEVCPSEIKEI